MIIPLTMKVLYLCYCDWLDSGSLPEHFNDALLWLLPKTEPEDGIFEASDTRPLSGANSDAKLLATSPRDLWG